MSWWITNALLSREIAALRNELVEQFKSIKGELKKMALSLDALTQAVNDEKTVEESAIALMNGLTTKIQDLITASGNTVDPAALQAIVDEVNANKAALAAAITANTPAAGGTTGGAPVA